MDRTCSHLIKDFTTSGYTVCDGNSVKLFCLPFEKNYMYTLNLKERFCFAPYIFFHFEAKKELDVLKSRTRSEKSSPSCKMAENPLTVLIILSLSIAACCCRSVLTTSKVCFVFVLLKSGW